MQRKNEPGSAALPLCLVWQPQGEEDEEEEEGGSRDG